MNNLKTLHELQFLLAWFKATLKYWNNFSPEGLLKDITFLRRRLDIIKERYDS